MYNLAHEEVIKVDETRRIIILTFEVQDGAGFTIQNCTLNAVVPADPESDETG